MKNMSKAPIGAFAPVGTKVIDTKPRSASKVVKNKLFKFVDITKLDNWDDKLPKQAKTILSNLPKFGVKYDVEYNWETISEAVRKMAVDGVLVGRKGNPIAQPASAILNFYRNYYKGQKETKVTLIQVNK
jgi:hypothetical protein|tara:strand:+ start:711 stop:1100 length:390 start_codon:yes stop_codon:yes gene_type:complete